MYESYWKLSCRPFEPATPSGAYYPCEVHQGAMLKLRYAIESRAAAALLAGEAGLGKTLVVDLLQQRAAGWVVPWVWVRYPQMPAAELLAVIANGFDPAGARQPVQRLDTNLGRITDVLAGNAQRQQHAVLVIDDAQSLPGNETLEALRLLTGLSPAGTSLLTILLVGQTTLLPRLDRMPAFEQRLTVKCLLRPLTIEETASYVTHRLTAAGAHREIFDRSALEALHQQCQGNPRRINRLADLALLVGYADELQRITAAEIDSVSDELVTLTANS